MHAVTQHVPWDDFDRLVGELKTDADTRGFNSKSHLMAMLFAQLSGAEALRDVEAGMASHADRLYHLGVTPAVRSTLADANRNRDSRLFSGLFARMIGRLDRGQRRALAETTYLLDATAIPLPSHAARWARFSATTCGVKMHVIYDAGAERPIGACPRAGQEPDPWAAVTASNVNDITAAHEMPIEAGATYVFDLGYYDFAWWSRLDAAQCRIVTRFKKNTVLRVVEELELPQGSAILSDRIGFLPTRLSYRRQNPLADVVREVRVRTETGKLLRIFINDLDAPAQQIAELYKRRWAIELFFRWVKQVLDIKHFLGRSENAVRIQLAVALIVFLLLRFAQATQKIVISPLEFARLVRRTLMDRRTIKDLRSPPEPAPRICIDQLVLL
jgi:transposase